MRNAHSRTWNMARKQKIKENEKYTLQDEKHGKKKTEKGGNFRNFHCRTWMKYGKKTENHGKRETST